MLVSAPHCGTVSGLDSVQLPARVPLRVLTDNGSCYCSRVFAQALGPDIKHKRTRPYRPQTKGNVERFNRTLLEEWAYIRPYCSQAERVAAFPGWLHAYYHRAHTARKGQAPASRVTNVSGHTASSRV